MKDGNLVEQKKKILLTTKMTGVEDFNIEHLGMSWMRSTYLGACPWKR